METVKQIVDSVFRDVTKKGYFDIVKGNEPIPTVINEPMSKIPEVMTKYVNECGFGCCFVFSAYMIDILNKYNINCLMITTLEDNGMRASVLYEDEGKYYIANPVEDIEFFTKMDVKPEDRSKFYIDGTASMVIDGKTHDDSRFTLEEFSEKYGTVWILGRMDSSSNETLRDAMGTQKTRCIMPPEDKNCDLNSIKIK